MSIIHAKTPEVQEMLSEWVHLYSDDLFSWAYHKTSDRSQAEDLVQDTFLAALQSLERFKGTSSPKTWLFSILNKKIIDNYRKKRRDALAGSNALEKESSGDMMDRFFDPYGNWKKESKPKDWEVEEVHLLDNEDFRNMLQGCMQKLPSTWLASLELKYLEGKEGKAICEVLGMKPTNYWQILHRAKLQLRACLEGNWFKS